MSEGIVFERPAWIGAIKVRSVFVPALFQVIGADSSWRIAFQILSENGSFNPYRINNDSAPYFASAEEAQGELDKMARAKRWTPIRRIERWEA